MKKIYVVLFVIVVAVVMVVCSTDVKESETNIQEVQSEQDELRQEVVDKFKDERDTLGTGKFIYDAYIKYPEDVTISAIYNYLESLYCYDAYIDLKDSIDVAALPESWLDMARIHALNIPLNYKGEFSEEINAYLYSFIEIQSEDEFEKLKLEVDVFVNLSVKDKKEIKAFIERRYEYYDKKEGEYAGDKYTKTIWDETAEKYGISEAHVDDIWSDLDLLQ